jgi:hypothetical protein
MAKEKKINWEEIMEDWRVSGKTQRAYCREKSISYWTFRDKLKTQNENGFVRITKVTSSLPIEPISLLIDERVQITLNVGYSRDLLRAILSDLGVMR